MLITLAEAKSYIGVSDTSEDTEITDLITAAGGALEGFCQRHLEEIEVTEYQDGRSVRTVYLREPANAKPTIYQDNDHAWGASTQITASDLLWVGDRDGTSRVVEYLDNYFTAGQKNLKIVYNAGFSTIPDAIKHACKIQVARMYTEWKRATQQMDGLKSQNVAGWAQTFLEKEGVDRAARDLLRPYVNVRL